MNIPNMIIVSILILGLCFIGQSDPIQPMFAGSIVLDDQIIKKNTCIFKQVPLIGSSDKYKAQGVQLIAYIRQMQMDDNLSFDFHYSIICKEKSECYFDLVYTRHPSSVNAAFQYSITIDFIVVKNAIIKQINMTQPKKSIDFQEQIEKQQKKQWQIIAFPNGFNKLSLTGTIQQSKMPNQNKFILNYISEQQEDVIQAWPSNKNFIFYTVLLIEKGTSIFKDFNKLKCDYFNQQCLKEENIFLIFLSTSDQQVQLYTKQQKNQRYGYLKLQNLAVNMDTRVIPKKIPFELKQSNTTYQILYVIALVLLGQVIYQLNKRHNARKQIQFTTEIDLPSKFDKISQENDLKTQLSMDKTTYKD